MEEGILDIFELAKLNRSHLEEEYMEILNKYAEKKSKFEQWKNIISNNYNISMNTSERGIFGFLNDGEYKNIHDLVKDGIKSHDDEYEKRKSFDDKLDNGRAFKYGALFIGGCGVKEYGRFCMVLDKNYFKKLCFVKQDSLKYYMHKKDGYYDVNMDKLKKHLSDKNNVHLLTIIKHHEDIINKNDKEEVKFVICGDNYIEAITIDDITPKSIIKIIYHVDKELRKNLEKYDLEYECDMLTLLENIITYYNKEILNESKKYISAKVENMSKLYDKMEYLANIKDLTFEVYVEYNNKKNPKKVWENV